MRCFEQIRTDLGYGARNAKVIGGYGGGLMYAAWGCTHHAMEEAALMRLIPTMTVVMPADAYETEHAVRAAAAAEGPFYISLAGGELPLGMPEADRSFEIGKALCLREGAAATVIATGYVVPEALRAADLLAERGQAVRVLNMHTLKPLDQEAVLCAARETPLIVTLEEHTVIGGLGSAVAEVLAEAGSATALKRLGVQDLFAVMCGDRDDFRRCFGISAEAVVETVLAGV
jgi:transketolase